MRCRVRQGHSYSWRYWLIYLFSSLTFPLNRYSSHSCWPIFMKFGCVFFFGTLGFLSLLKCAYIAIICKVMATFFFQLKQLQLHLRYICACYVKFTHHNIDLMKSIRIVLVPTRLKSTIFCGALVITVIIKQTRIGYKLKGICIINWHTLIFEYKINKSYIGLMFLGK